MSALNAPKIASHLFCSHFYTLYSAQTMAGNVLEKCSVKKLFFEQYYGILLSTFCMNPAWVQQWSTLPILINCDLVVAQPSNTQIRFTLHPQSRPTFGPTSTTQSPHVYSNLISKFTCPYFYQLPMQSAFVYQCLLSPHNLGD